LEILQETPKRYKKKKNKKDKKSPEKVNQSFGKGPKEVRWDDDQS